MKQRVPATELTVVHQIHGLIKKEWVALISSFVVEERVVASTEYLLGAGQ